MSRTVADAPDIEADAQAAAKSLQPGRARRVTPPPIVLLVAAGGVFTAFVDATIVNTIFPEIQRSFRSASIEALSWIFNAYSIVTAAFLIPAGRLADVIGRRRVFRTGIVVFALGSVLCAVAPSLGVLVAARILQAFGGALLIPSSLALVLDAHPATSRSHAVAMWSAAAALAAGVGPALGGSLVELSGWRLAFLINVPIGVALYVATGRTIVESRAPGRRVLPDALGGALVAVSVAALVLAIVKVNDWGAASPGFAGCMVVAVATLAVFVVRSRSHRAPLVDLALLRIPAFGLANLLMVCAAIAYYSYLLCNILFLTSVWGYSVLEAGLALTPGPFVAAGVSGIFARVVARFGHRAALVPGALLWGAGVVWLIIAVGSQPAFLSEWLPAMVLLGVGAGASFPTLASAAIAAAPAASFATTTALNSVARQLGAALGVALLVAIIGSPGPAELGSAFDDGWMLAAVLFAAVAVAALALRGLHGAADEPVEPLRSSPVGALPELTVTAGAGGVARLSAFFAEVAAPSTESILDVLARTAFFGEMPSSSVAALAAGARSLELAPGDRVYAAGERARHVYVVRSGRVRVVRDRRDDLELGRGSVLGAITALAGGRYGESVVALRDSELIVVERDGIDRLTDAEPALSRALIGSVSRRLQEAPRPAARPEAPAIVALVPLDAGVSIGDVAARLSDALGRLGSAGLLDGSERAVAEGESYADVFGPLLAQSEWDVERTLLVCSSRLDEPWTAFCLRHADRIVAVASAADVPQDADELRGADLVLLGGGPTPVALVEALEPRALHRVGAGTGDMERLARRLAGRSLGLVLSGGGARAFAHLGVLSELMANGLVIDRVGGCSMGAFIGALLAGGMTPAEIDAVCYDRWVRSNPLTDYTLPRTSLVRGKLVEQMLQETFGEQRVEDLDRSFYAVSADLRAQSTVIHRDGPLWFAIAASMCLPVIAPPRVVGRQLLVDGSLLDNLPVEAMAATGEGPVLAVDIKARKPGAGGSSNGTPARVSTRPPALMNTLARVLLLASANTSAQAARYADRVISVPVGGVGLLEWHQIDAAIQDGVVAARAAFDEHGPDLGLGPADGR